MQRALQLARLGEGNVAPNPMVGAVLVYQQRVIGEGYHAVYGAPHAEINCLNSVAEGDRSLIALSTMYVTLEPCAHYGKTPPCALRLIQEKVGRVVVGMKDPFAAVAGRGIQMLRDAGIPVEVGLLEDTCRQLNKKFLRPIFLGRPFITLKWAEQANGIIGHLNEGNLAVSSALSRRWVHHLRSLHMGILVGYRTALLDNPSLTVRYASGKNPLRIIIDFTLNLPNKLKVFQDGEPTWLIHADTVTPVTAGYHQKVRFVAVKRGQWIADLLAQLQAAGIQSLLVEGGAATLQQFIDKGLYDEAYCLKSNRSHASAGVLAPKIPGADWAKQTNLDSDQLFCHTSSHDESLH